MLIVKGLRAGYGSNPVLDGIDLAVRPGETLAVVGRSGSGKTTLLLSVAGLLPPWEGTSELDGRPLEAGNARVGLVFQDLGLFPWLTVRENIALGLRIRGVPRDEREDAAAGGAGRVAIPGCLESYPASLSGGQKQRAALARTLVTEPDVLLMDEPFSSLDALTREALQDLVRGLLAERPIVGVLVTHSIEEAVYLGSVLGVLHGRPARLTTMLNPAPGVSRTDPSFFEACRRLRGLLEEVS